MKKTINYKPIPSVSPSIDRSLVKSDQRCDTMAKIALCTQTSYHIFVRFCT